MLSRINFRYLLYGLLIFYVLFLAIAMAQISSLLNESRQYISHARDATTGLRSRVNELVNILPGLFSSPDLNFAAKEAELKRLAISRDENIEGIEKYFRGDPEIIVGLKTAFMELRRQLRKDAALLEDNASYNLALESFNLETMPHIRQIRAYLNEIDAASATMSAQVQEKIRNRMTLTLLVSIIFGGMIIIIFIVTDRREQAKSREVAHRERLFDQLSRNVEEVFIIAANSGKFVYVSPNSRQLLNAGAEALVANTEELYKLLEDPEIVSWLKKILEGLDDQSGTERTLDIPALQKSFRIRVFPLDGNSASEEKFIVSLNDQTQSIRHQEALSIALENAHAASAAKSSFLSHMSHEIRTPMNAIIGMTTIALSRLGDQTRVQDCLTKIAESSHHLLGIINDVLDMSKIESGKLSINNECFNLHQSIGNITNLVRPQAKSRQLRFDIYLDGVEDEDLIGDSLRLNQILLNLLSNACKFTPPEGSVTLRIQELDQNRNSARFRFIVEDTGIGMSEEFLTRVYAPFEQATPSTTSKFGGTGLGMTITSNLVSLMGGVIQVESREGQGTKFTVELPFGICNQSGAKNRELPKLKVLVVDDDAGTCEHAVLLLAKMGLETRWTTSGADAVKLVREAQAEGNGYDVCLIDWKMPDMDGAETARQIRMVSGNDTLIIIFSAFDWSPIEDEARKAGVNDFIAKPFFSSSLYDALLSATTRLKAEPIAASKSNQRNQYNFSGKRILLVEDNDFNREIAQEFLEMAHAEVECAENGQEAVDMTLNSSPGYYDLVLMDIQMPVMDGYKATSEIRSSSHPDAASLPILAMTANAFSEDISHAMAAGMNGHIAKPIDVKMLYELLKEHLNKKK